MYLQQEDSMDYSGQNSHLLHCLWITRNVIDSEDKLNVCFLHSFPFPQSTKATADMFKL